MQVCWHMSFQSGHMQCPGRGLGNMLAIMNKQYLSYMIIWVSVKFMKLEKNWVICIVNQNRSFVVKRLIFNIRDLWTSPILNIIPSPMCTSYIAKRPLRCEYLLKGLPWWPCGLRRCHWLLAVSHHCTSSNPIREMWASCQWLGVRRWFSLGTPVTSTSYNWLVTT